MQEVFEIWKDIEGYEGCYQVSNKGNIRSVDRYIECRGSLRMQKGKVLKPYVNKYGYRQVILNGKNRPRLCRINRLVAQAFIPNPNNLPQVNHKDEIKTNDCVENLEWCTFKYNTEHAIKNGLKPVACGNNIQRVLQLNIRDLSINQVFDNIACASRIIGCNESCIYGSIVQKRPYSGFYYIREHDYSENIDKSYFRSLVNRKHRIRIGDRYVSGIEYSRITGIPRCKVYEMIKNGELESEVV